MKLYIKQKVLTLGERFTVWDESNEPAYYVEGSFLKIPKQFTIYNAMGEKQAVIDRQLFRLFARYDIKTVNNFVTLKRHFSFFRQSFSIEGINWRVDGDFFNHNYTIYERNTPIMQLRKHWFKIGDSYELDIRSKEDEVLALALTIAIDYEILRDQSSNNSN